MIQESSERLLQQTQVSLLEVVKDVSRPQSVLREQCRLVTDALGALQDFVSENPFADVAAEISYQKEILPRFLSLLFHARSHYELFSGVPESGAKAHRKYYAGFLKQISGFHLFDAKDV